MYRKNTNLLNNLKKLYVQWRGDEDTLARIRAFLMKHQSNSHFIQDLSSFKRYINSTEGNHPFKYKRTNFFYDSYYVTESPSFNQLNQLIDSFLLQPEKKSIHSKLQNFTQEVPQELLRLVRTIIQFLYEQPVKAFLIIFGLFALMSAMKPSSTKLSNETNHEPGDDLEANTHLKVFNSLQLSPNTSQCLPLAQSKFDSPTSILTNQKTIRVCLSRGPNLGDQSIAISIMDRFRKLGFKGKFELIYDNEVKDAVITLFNLPDNIPPVYASEETNIVFFELAAHQAYLKDIRDPIDLGFTVGKCGIICDAQTTKINSFIHFSPYFDEKGGAGSRTYIGFFNGTEIGQTNSSNKYFVFDLPTHEQTRDFLFRTSAGNRILASKPALNTFLDGMEQRVFNVFPIYGRTLRFTEEQGPNYDLLSTSPSNILNTIAGARYAQLNGPPEFQKPLIITVYHDFQKNADTLRRLISQEDWGTFEKPGADAARKVIRELELDKVFITASITDPHTSTIIKKLKPGQILLLSMGRFPKKVFEGLFTYNAENIWPKVREGAGTFNALINSGSPQFECGNKYGPISEISFFSKKNNTLLSSLREFYDADKGYCKDFASWEKDIYKLLGLFIIDAHNTNSEFSQFFQELKKEATKPENDRILYALDAVAKRSP